MSFARDLMTPHHLQRTLGHETDDLVRAPETARAEAVGKWTQVIPSPNLPPAYTPLSVEDQQRLDAIADQVHQEWQEWKGVETQLDFRAWVAGKRLTQLHAQQQR